MEKFIAKLQELLPDDPTKQGEVVFATETLLEEVMTTLGEAAAGAIAVTLLGIYREGGQPMPLANARLQELADVLVKHSPNRKRGLMPKRRRSRRG